jgi:putative nucleotidyltransferase with HDIG domain
MLRSGESAVVYALVIAPLTALQLNSHIPAAVSLVASLVAANRLGGRGGRSALPAAALEAGLAASTSVMALALFNGRMWMETVLLGLAAFIGGTIVSPLSAAIVAPLLEPIFGYVSESRLARLANLNHPALKELIIRAPGTYHHSLIVGALAESGARKVGAHPLLARVGGYYHDLGKADAPLMFGENQKSENRLEKLPPEEAAQVLRKHISDGIARAEAAHLPRVLVDFIIQHHGDAATGAFYESACAAAEREGRPLPDERAFHYPGPRPRSREIALVLLADAVEAASRTLPDPTEERLRAMVVQVVQEVVRRGQLNDCDLTLSDILLATGAFQDTLVEMHSLSRVDVLPTLRPSGLPQPERPEATIRAIR